MLNKGEIQAMVDPVIGRTVLKAEVGSDSTIMLTFTDGTKMGLSADVSSGFPYVVPTEQESDEELRLKHQQASEVLTCVYCGHRYPPGTPPSNHVALTLHIRRCKKHPMRETLEMLARVKDHLSNKFAGDFLPPGYKEDCIRLASEIERLL